VLVRVCATSINPYDWHLMRGEPRVARLIPGGPGLRPAIRVLGCDVAGRVATVGDGVTAFQPGDDVIGLLPGGGFGEYACGPAAVFTAKPDTVSYEQAAALPMAGVTALLAVRGGRACRSVLTRDGVLALVGGPAGRWVQPAGHAFVSLAGGAFARQRVRLVDAVASTDKGVLLTELAALVKDGLVRPVIDRRYPFPELPAALRYQEAGHAPGKVIVTR
jgi:NADPH:quinone reductase-like Zn-dependent oxidoreductase